MSAAFSRGKRGNLSLYVPTRTGRVQRSTGTTDPAVVRGMKRMVVQLKDEHRWVVLDAIRDGRVTLSRAYQHHTARTLPALEADLTAVNLADHLDGWQAWVRANRREGVGTDVTYRRQVETLLRPGTRFLAPELTKARVTQWLAGRQITSGSKRKNYYALRSFVRYLMDVGVYDADPLAGFKSPKKNPKRRRWADEATDRAITDAAAPKYRALFAFVKATGADLSSALRAQRGDVDLQAGTVTIRGTKTDRRHVEGARIEPWALPVLRAHCAGVVGRHTPLFPGLTRSGASHHHEHCCRAVGVEDLTLKDSRHSVALRMRAAGASFEAIARQLGTSLHHVVTVYSDMGQEQAQTTVTRQEATG